MKHPYAELPASAFWRSAVGERRCPDSALYHPRWPITGDDSIATAGSCFAQHIGHALRSRIGGVLDVEPAPPALPPSVHSAFGYGLYSARYGNIYTTRQLVQLAEQALGHRDPTPLVWTRGERFYDALRPTVEPEGLDSVEEVALHREWHLGRVAEMLRAMDVFVFTLGLTEVWLDRATGLALPTAPGVVAGAYAPEAFRLVRLSFGEVVDDLERFLALVAAHRAGRPLRLLLTVSPVPLTATASDAHVLVATCESKAILRAAAGELRARRPDVDYFPSYELIANPFERGVHYAANRRSVTPDGVARAMALFFAAHDLGDTSEDPAATPAPQETLGGDGDPVCEEALLEAFAP